jgi:hypothetical protein
MTTGTVIEVLRRLEPVTPDPFIDDEWVRPQKNPARSALPIGFARVSAEPDRRTSRRGLEGR